MIGREEEQAFLEYLSAHGCRKTRQRQAILGKFLAMKGHVSTDELYRAVRKAEPGIGYATVSRFLNLLKDARIVSEMNFTGKRKRYEPERPKAHHDHLVCTGCGRTIELFDTKMEKWQQELLKGHHFDPAWHKMEIFGKCKSCR